MGIQSLFNVDMSKAIISMTISSGVVLFLFTLLYFLNNFIFNSIISKLSKYPQSPFRILRGGVRILIVIIGFISVLDSWGVDVTTLIASFGVMGFVITFALKDLLTSLLSGVLIMVHRPFKVGDKIIILDFEGVVKEIDMQSTTIVQGNKSYAIPNTKVFSDGILVRDLDSRSSK